MKPAPIDDDETRRALNAFLADSAREMIEASERRAFTAAVAARKRGRPTGGVKLAEAHRLKVHEGYDANIGAPIVYEKELRAGSRDLKEASRLYNNAASKGAALCEKCGNKSRS